MDHQTFAQLLGNYGEFVGAIAVVLTLGYLAMQIRQSNVASQSTAIQTFFDSFSSVNLSPSRDVEYIQLLRKGFETWEGLSKDEQAQMHLYWNDYFSKLHMGYRLYVRGVLDEESYGGWENFFLASVQTPGVGSLWRSMTQVFPDDFCNRIDQRLSDKGTLPSPVTELLPYWATDVEEQ